MVDRENREDWRRERSLLALGQAVRGEDNTVSIGDRVNSSWREDAAARHRAARSEREARIDPRPADTDEFGYALPEPAPEPIETDADRARTDAAIERREKRRVPDDSPRAAFEPRSAGRPPAGRDFDAQEWKPLIDPVQVVHGITRSKALILSTTILGAVLGVAIALSTPKKYEATTDVIVDPRDLKLTDRDLTQNVVASDATLAIVENQVRILTSSRVLDKVVADLDLIHDPEFNGQGSGGLGIMSLIRSVLLRHDALGSADEARQQALTVGNLAKSLDVERGGKTFVVSVSATTQDPKKSADIANAMVTAFKDISSDIQKKTAGRATDELTARLEELRKGVETAERNVENFRATHDLVDAQGHLISDDQMLKLNEQLSVARARTLELNARAASARSLDVNSVLSGTLPEELSSNTMSELRSQYAQLKQEADRAAIKFGPRHPEIQALNAQIAGARERIGAELQRIAASLQVDLKRSVQLEQDLSSRLAQAKVQSGDVNNNLVSLRELEREAAAKRSVYEQFLLRAKETGEQKDINTANISVISDAYPPLEAKGPSRAVKALAGLLAGLFGGIGLGALRGAYASLRETADSRSRGGTDERRPVFEEKAHRAPPPPVPPAPSTGSQFNDEDRAGRAGSIAASLRSLWAAVTRRPDVVASVAPAAPGAMPRASKGEPPVAAEPRRTFQSLQQGQPSSDPRPAGRFPDQPAPDAGQVTFAQQPVADTRAVSDADQQGQIDEIRASLREFREAVRELTESRSRRRYF
ncbi:MAG: GumC family protein [Pseudomonadota bacterium]